MVSDVAIFHRRRDPVVTSWRPGSWVATRGLRNTGLDYARPPATETREQSPRTDRGGTGSAEVAAEGSFVSSPRQNHRRSKRRRHQTALPPGNKQKRANWRLCETELYLLTADPTNL